MAAVAEVGVVEAAPEHEGLDTIWGDVSSSLLEEVVRLVRILVVDGGFTAAPCVLWDGHGIEQLADSLPGGNALSDDVEEGGAVVVIPPVFGIFQKLADLDFDEIADGKAGIFRLLMGDGDGVAVVSEVIRDPVVVIFGDRINTPEKGAEFGGSEFRLGLVIEDDTLAAFGDPIGDRKA